MVNVIHNPRIVFRPMITAAEEMRTASFFEAYPAVINEYRFTNANEMTVYETSIWIWTLGYNFQWLNAEFYAKSFRDNEIAGSMLPMLSLRQLEDLGIRNRNHCMVIKRAINFCFPRTNEYQFRVPIGMEPVELRHGRVVSSDQFMALNRSIFTGSVSVHDMAESVSSTNASLSLDSKISSTVPIRRSLVLTLSPEQKIQFG